MPESGRDGQTGMQDERYGIICSRRKAVSSFEGLGADRFFLSLVPLSYQLTPRTYRTYRKEKDLYPHICKASGFVLS